MPEVIRELAAEMLESAGELAAEMTAHLHRNIPELGGDDLDLMRATRASCESNIVQSYRLLQSGGDVNDFVVPPEATQYVRGLVSRGIKVPVLLRTYRLGHALTWDRWADELRERADSPEELARAIEYSSRWMFAYIDMISAALVEEFAGEQARRVRSAEQVRAATVRAVLAGELDDDEVAARRLGYQLRRSHLALHIWSDQDETRGLERAAREAVEATGCKSQLIVASGGAALDVWCAGTEAAIEQAPEKLAAYEPPAGIRIAYAAAAATGIPGFRQAHLQARQAARVAMIAGDRLAAVTGYAEIELVSLLLEDVDRAREFMTARLGPLAAGDEQAERLRQTATAYLRHNRSASHAAKELFVHQNTVTYRIRQVEELLGRPVTEGQTELLCALKLAELLGPTSMDAPAGSPKNS